MSRSRVTIAAARWWVNWSCVLLSACGLCGAFLLPHATQAPVVRHRHRILSARYPLQHSVRYPVVHGGSKALCRMQVGGDDELQLAVQNLAAQVEDLTAMVKQLADETMATAGKAGAPSQSINGAAVENHAAVPVAASAPSMVKAKSDAERTELVDTTNAQQRIDQWLKEQGLLVLTAEVPQPAAPRDIEAASSAAVAPAEAAPVAAPPLEETPAGISSETGYKVKIEWDGTSHEITCDAETTVLDAAMDAGLELPHSCMSGSCLTCPGKLISGSVDQSEGVLEDEQTEAGYMLTCISYPLSDLHFTVIEEDELP